MDRLNIIKDYVNNNDQYKFLDLVNLVLTTNWHTPLGTLLILSFTNKFMVLQWEDQHLQPKQKFLCRLINKLLMTFLPFLNVRTWKTFSITSKIFIKTLSLLWRTSVPEKYIEK